MRLPLVEARSSEQHGRMPIRTIRQSVATRTLKGTLAEERIPLCRKLRRDEARQAEEAR